MTETTMTAVDDYAITWTNVRKVFVKDQQEIVAVGDVTLRIKRGEFVSIIGPSGCGKSTLLNMTAGLMRQDGGEVVYEGSPVEGVNTSVGYMTQKDTLLPWRTVAQNAVMPLEIRGVPKPERQRLLDKHIEMVGLKGFEKHYPRELSGGMRKRASLIRTLIYEPQTLLMDEPFGTLDAQLKSIMQEELLRIWSGSGKTVVFVTHDLHEAIALSDRVVVMSRRPGTIKLDITVPIPRPRNVVEIGLDGGKGAQIARELWAALKEDIREGEEVK